MRRSLLLTAILLLSYEFNLTAQQLPVRKKNDLLKLDLSGGYQQEDFDWSIAGNSEGTDPNIYSELIWKRLKSTVASIGLQSHVWRGVYFEATYSRSKIYSGEATDTDYFGDNRTSPAFSANLNSNRGYTRQFRIGLGYRLLDVSSFYLLPFAGYATHHQKLSLTDDVPGSSLNSTYKAFWSGPYLSIQSGLRLPKKFSLDLMASYHQVDYKAHADWNTIEEFQHPVSFRHTAKGFGFETSVKAGRRLTKSLGVYMVAQTFWWKTGAGMDELFLSTGDVAVTKLNSAARDGYKLGAGLEYQF